MQHRTWRVEPAIARLRGVWHRKPAAARQHLRLRGSQLEHQGKEQHRRHGHGAVRQEVPASTLSALKSLVTHLLQVFGGVPWFELSKVELLTWPGQQRGVPRRACGVVNTQGDQQTADSGNTVVNLCRDCAQMQCGGIESGAVCGRARRPVSTGSERACKCVAASRAYHWSRRSRN